MVVVGGGALGWRGRRAVEGERWPEDPGERKRGDGAGGAETAEVGG